MARGNEEQRKITERSVAQDAIRKKGKRSHKKVENTY
jgi:hypothetical protein